VKPRKSLLITALIAAILVVSGEIGGGVWLVRPPQKQQNPVSNRNPLVIGGRQVDPHSVGTVPVAPSQLARPGFGIPYLPLLDVLLLVTYFFTAASILLPERAIAPASAVTSLIISLLVLLASILGIFTALNLTLAMVGLLLSFPFGTAVYLAVWGSFPVGAAAATLGVLLFLKLAFAVCLLVANPRFIQNKGLVLLTGTSILAGVIVAFLHGLPPGILASITDGIAGILVGVAGLVWAIVVLVWAVIGLVRIIVAARLPVPG
jgi:hypothetical protein